MKCDLCDSDKPLLKFYWGFFNAEYDPTKWINLCEDCQSRFLKASNVYGTNNNDLWLMYREIEAKVNNDEKGIQRIKNIENQRRY